MNALAIADNGRSSGGLEFLWLEVTSKCNLECVHCYADSGPSRELTGAMSLKGWLRVLHDAADEGCQAVQFIGGEPTLHPHLAELIRNADSIGYRSIEVFTNATFVREDLLSLFREVKVSIATSFYSDDAEVHDAISQRRGSFHRTVEGISRYVEAGLSLRASVIETALNEGHSERAVGLLRRLGVHSIGIDGQRDVGRGERSPSRVDPMASLCGECIHGRLCVTASGSIYPCVFSRFASVGTAKEGVKAALRSTALESFRRHMKMHNMRANQADECEPLKCGPTCSPQNFRCGPVAKCSPDPRGISRTSQLVETRHSKTVDFAVRSK